jgi:hypothetical protein
VTTTTSLPDPVALKGIREAAGRGRVVDVTDIPQKPRPVRGSPPPRVDDLSPEVRERVRQARASMAADPNRPGIEAWVKLIEASTEQLDELVERFPADEQMDAALQVYVDADGQLQTRHGRFRVV